MSNGIEFEEDNFGQNQFSPVSFSRQNNFSNENSGMVAWLLKKNIAKSEKGAEVIMIGIIIINVAIMVGLLFFVL